MDSNLTSSMYRTKKPAFLKSFNRRHSPKRIEASFTASVSFSVRPAFFYILSVSKCRLRLYPYRLQLHGLSVSFMLGQPLSILHLMVFPIRTYRLLYVGNYLSLRVSLLRPPCLSFSSWRRTITVKSSIFQG